MFGLPCLVHLIKYPCFIYKWVNNSKIEMIRMKSVNQFKEPTCDELNFFIRIVRV